MKKLDSKIITLESWDAWCLGSNFSRIAIVEATNKKSYLKLSRILVEKMGFEPTTSWLPAKRSSQVSYIPKATANKVN